MANQSQNPSRSDIILGFYNAANDLALKLETTTIEKYSTDNFVKYSKDIPYTVPGKLIFSMFQLPPKSSQYYIPIVNCNDPAILHQLSLLLQNIKTLLENRPEFSSNKELSLIKDATNKIYKSLKDKLSQLAPTSNGWTPSTQTTAQLDQEANKVKSEWPTLLNGVTDDDTRRKKLVTLALLSHLETFMEVYRDIMYFLEAWYKSKKKYVVVPDEQ